MADINYLYAPYYGVEPFDPATTGAKVTGQNLVISAWNITDKSGGNPLLEIGDLIQPASQSDHLEEVRKAFSEPAFNSRCSAQVFLMNEPEIKVPEISAPLFVLNPPPELKQLLTKALTYNGGDPTDPLNYTVLRSLMGAYTWRVRWDIAGENQNSVQGPVDCIALFGTPIDLGTYGGTADTQLPFLKTNGADGQTPEFFDNTTADGTAEMLAAINQGNFFVPLAVFTESLTVPARFTITYPHSVARG